MGLRGLVSAREYTRKGDAVKNSQVGVPDIEGLSASRVLSCPPGIAHEYAIGYGVDVLI